jgi:hypothetical protein
VLLDVLRAGVPESELDDPGGVSAMDLPLPQLALVAARCHSGLFGPDVTGVVGCAACGERLDVTVPLDGLLAQAVGGAPAPPPGLRCPTSRDLVAAAAAPDGAAELLRRCAPGAGGASPSVRRALDEALEDVVGPALPVVRAACPGCGEEVRAVVDPLALLWQRVEDLVPRLLDDVARLARAFGWSEADVLALGPHRRAAYLRLVAP